MKHNLFPLFPLLALLVSLCSFAAAADSEVIIEKDPVTGKVMMRSKPKGGVETSAAATPAARAIPAPPRTSTVAASGVEAEKINTARGKPPRSALGLLLGIGGGCVALIGYIWLLVAMARESLLWLLGGLLFAPTALVFAFMHWQEAKAPFLTNILGYGVMVAAAFVA